jgi:hypothetical protein
MTREQEYLGQGYALLLKALAAGLPCVLHADIDAGRWHPDVRVTLYLANVAFNTAEMLAEGINPFAPLGPGEKSWATPEGREAMRAKARR